MFRLLLEALDGGLTGGCFGNSPILGGHSSKDDSYHFDRRGRVLSFPLRLGVRPEQNPGIPSEYLRTIRRMEFDLKTLIDIEYFRERLGHAVEPGCIPVGERNLGEVSEIVPLARHRALHALAKYSVVGLGIYQGMEFVLERGLWELLDKVGVAALRLYNSLILLTRAPAYRFVLGRSMEKTARPLSISWARRASESVPSRTLGFRSAMSSHSVRGRAGSQGSAVF